MDKDFEITPAVNAISIPMMEATSELAENLAQSEPLLRYQAADRRLNADPEAKKLLAEFSELQQKIRAQHDSGTIIESDIHQLRELQRIISTNDAIQDQRMAQELAVAFLREVNQEISNLLGVDFASLTRRSGGCC
ncbi:MAG: YlbF family regulator [Chloroflexi bacterium]|nr:YlbF family regulator [Chloroflexota bacterium]